MRGTISPAAAEAEAPTDKRYDAFFDQFIGISADGSLLNLRQQSAVGFPGVDAAGKFRGHLSRAIQGDRGFLQMGDADHGTLCAVSCWFASSRSARPIRTSPSRI